MLSFFCYRNIINMLQTLGIIILVLLFLFTLQVINTRSTESCLLTGFWKGSPQFITNSGLQMFMIRIGEGRTLSGKRPGYILMVNKEGILINSSVEFSLSAGGSLRPGLCPCREYSVTIDWLDDGEPEFFPSEQDLYYYPEAGKLVFTSGDSVMGVFYKDYITGDINDSMPDDLPRQDTGEGEDI
jgi:hypothetical protein